MRPNDLDGKVAIVTGASRGIGAAAARAFGDAGATVVLAARSSDAIEREAEQIRIRGGRARSVPTDVSDEASVRNLVDVTVEEFGRLDIAFNNAGGGHMPTPIADMTPEAFDASVAGNLRSVFLCMKFEIQAMLCGGAGAIVNMSSTAGVEGVRGLSAYSAAKHGIIGLTKSAAREYAASNIRVNVLAPGPILTERLAQSPQARESAAAHIPAKRVGTPEEVAAAAVWLCTDAAAFIHGNVLLIDGGKLAGQN